MASNDVLQPLLNILDGSYSREETDHKLIALKRECERNISKGCGKNLGEDLRCTLCHFSRLQFSKSQESRASNHYPVRTSGDGNCLYNACSIALNGTETLATYLRCLTSIELHMNASYYSSHPLIEQQHNEGAFSCQANAFAMCLSDKALESLSREDPSKAVLAEAYNNAHNHHYSPFLCLLSLSSAIGLPIESYYPIPEDNPQGEMGSLACMFNCTIFPRAASGEDSLQGESRIHIFRCASQPLDYIERTVIPQTKNHYVALCQSEANTCQDLFAIKPLLPSFSFDSAILQDAEKIDLTFVGRQDTGVSNDSMPSTNGQTTTHTTGGSKLRQAVLDRMLITKKRKFEDEVDQALPQNEITMTPDTARCPSSEKAQSSCHALGPVSSRFPNDIGNFVNPTSPLSNQQKYHLLLNVWKPDETYVFPVTLLSGRARKFRYQWLRIYPWLVYSEVLKGAFCINCFLFGSEVTGTHNVNKLDKLFKTPLTSWSVAATRFRDHAEKSQLHRDTTLRSSRFKLLMEQKATSIDVQLDSLRRKQIEENRKKLHPIVDAVIVCGRQNISFRGHRDDSKYLDDDGVNTGNFQAILQYGARCANISKEDYLHSTPRNATYRSKTTQNQLIDICGELLTSEIVSKVKEAKFFSILADEATDCANIEQMSLVVRYVDKTPAIREDFLGFVPCKLGVSGEAIATTILNFLRELDLSIDHCRGQGYDGAGNMAGRLSGAATRIMAHQEKAIYVHCNSHILNLCVAACCNEQLVRNMMEHVRVASEFFNFSPKRFDLLTKTIEELLPKAKHTRLIDVCRTRWVSRIDGFGVFVELFPAIVRCFEEIRDNVGRHWNVESVQKASSLYYGTVAFQFITTLVIVSRCLEVTRPLTKQLQYSTYDAGSARENVSLLYVMLRRLRSNVEARHDLWFKEATALAQTVDTTPAKPRTTGRQQHRANTPAESISEYYLRIISIPFLDHLTSEVQNRFTERNLDVMNALYGTPKYVLTNPDWETRFSRFLDIYKDDLPEPRYLSTELEMWREKCRMTTTTLPSTLKDILPFVDKTTFPNIYTAFQIFATIPVTTCSCERSISGLRRLKLYLRNSMSESRLKGLALLHVHRKMPVDIDEVIDRFASKHPRRMALADILNSD